MYEDDCDYAARRLNNTVVRLTNGNLFCVLTSEYNDAGKLCHLGDNYISGERELVLHSDLNLEPIPLGFVNTSSDMVFLARKPMRRDWRQGLSHNSLVTYGRLRPSDVNYKLLVQPVLQQYPTFTRALESLSGKKTSIAFSREFGLAKQGNSILLRFRQHDVGEVKDGQVTLYPKKFFLQQHLDEAMGA